MSRQPPKLSKHARGSWFVKWGGKTHYFGTDRDAAEHKFLDPRSDHPGAMHRWMEWKHTRLRASEQRAPGSDRVVDVAERLLTSYIKEGKPETVTYYRSHLKRFLNVYGTIPIYSIDLGALRAFREDLLELELSPKTVGHDITAVKRLFNWAQENELGPMINLKAIKKPHAPIPESKRLSFEELCGWIRKAHNANPNLAAHLALQYVTAMRPSEVLRVTRGEGRFEEVLLNQHNPLTNELKNTVIPAGCFVIKKSKTEEQTGYPRHVMMTPQAHAWLEVCEPAWKDMKSYSKAVRAALGAGGPKLVQKTAVWHLELQGVDRADADLIQGHVPSAVQRHYGPRAWGRLWDLTRRISI